MLTLLSGEHVHQADTVNETLLAAMTKNAPPVAERVPGISKEIASVIDRALAFDPKERFPDARAMQAALREAYSDWRMSDEQRAAGRESRHDHRVHVGLTVVLLALPVAFG